MTIRVPECAFENMNFDWSESWLAGTEKAGKMVGDDQNPCIGIKDGSGKPATKTAALESPLYNPDIAYIFYYPDATILIFNDFSKKLSTRFKMK